MGFQLAASAVADVMAAACTSFCLCSATLPGRIFDTQAVITAARGFARKNPKTAARLLIVRPRQVTSRPHPFVEMCQLFPDTFEVHTLSENVAAPSEDFLFNDQFQGVRFPQPGHSRFFLPDRHARAWLETVFEELWHHSTPAVELRRLSL